MLSGSYWRPWRAGRGSDQAVAGSRASGAHGDTVSPETAFSRVLADMDVRTDIRKPYACYIAAEQRDPMSAEMSRTIIRLR